MKQVYLFNGIPKAEVVSILKAVKMKEQKYVKGEFILSCGDTVSSLGLIAKGSAQVIQEDYWGNSNLIADFSAGEVFAESFACSEKKELTIDVIATDDCVILWFNIGKILSLTADDTPYYQQLVHNLLHILAQKNLYLNSKLTHIGQRSTREKLMSYLSSQSQMNNSETFDISFSRQELADYLCVERSAMSAELSRMKADGIIDYKLNHFTLLSD